MSGLIQIQKGIQNLFENALENWKRKRKGFSFLFLDSA
jgi:hypothetical protein